MLEAKKKALEGLKDLVGKEMEKKIKVVVEGDTKEEVEKGLKAAQEKMKEMPEKMDDDMDMGVDDLAMCIKKLSPEDKKKLMKMVK